ncbi:MAG: ornithine cyclodeaminase family protein [Chloroflexi bacterium]|nr:ornithine cyclodeaminase family protein [Chloroflexota bacterium]
MVLWLTEKDVRSLLTMEMALEAVEESFHGLAEGTATNMPRRRISHERNTFHLMFSAVGSRNVIGVKAYNTYGGPVDFLIPLYSTETGRLIALIEGDWLGRVRTGAASGVASKYLARPGSKTLSLFGTGSQAQTQMLAVCAALGTIERVNVYSRNAENRATFVAEMQPQVKAQIVAVNSPEATLEGADVIATMTTSKEPVFRGDLLPPGVHINAAGSNHARRREIDGETVRRCARIAVDSIEQAKMECGDLIAAVEEKITRWDDMIEFADIVGGKTPGRSSPDEITLFESQGISVWDVATAARVYELAVERSVGQKIEEFHREENN